MKTLVFLSCAIGISIISAHIITAPVYAVKRNIDSKPRAMRAREEQLRKRFERRSRSQKVLSHEIFNLDDYRSQTIPKDCGARGCGKPADSDEKDADQIWQLVEEDYIGDTWDPLSNPDFKLPAVDVDEMSQITEISVGTPPQKIRVIISISDNDLFIPSYKWDEDSPGRHWIYNSSLSSSFNATNSETFSGYFRLGGSSDISKETVHIAGMTLKEQSFDEGVNFYYRTDIFSSDEGWDGYLGLAPSKNGSISGIPSIYQSMVSRGLLDRNIFSLKLSRGLEDPGEIMFGGINHDLYTGPLKSIPLVPDNEKMERVKGRWNVPLTSITLGDGSVELEDYVATLESDFPLIGLQDEYVKLLNNYMGTETKINFGAPSIDCRKRDQLENLTIRLGEHDFVIGPYEYTWEVYLQEWKGLRCVSAFVGMDLVTHENYVLLGSAFLRNFYGVFDSEGGTVSLGNAVAREKTR